MKRGATKEEIIRTTLDLITRNGLRAVRVDEIAQMLGISKRTLYEMFADKNDLISACLNDMARQQRQHIDADRKRRSGNALQKTLRLVNTYVDSLYKVDPSFLSDIRHKIVFAEYYDEHREFWFRELTRDFDVCRNEGLLLAEIDSRSLAEQLIGTLFELRLNNTSREELYMLSKTILRGAATHPDKPGTPRGVRHPVRFRSALHLPALCRIAGGTGGPVFRPAMNFAISSYFIIPVAAFGISATFADRTLKRRKNL